ncbi:uncharacterized protein LOC143532207 [Bidens hawaiensis]|uniref:uncharacterized protein LOC143532207 n=1 Tax=Bidens hawaiensis TaxID=980011 RepID=UPI0040497539
MYSNSEASVCTPVGDTDFFPVEVGLHQGSTLSPFLFAVVLEELSKSIQEPVPWCMLFADDIVLIPVSKQDLNMRLEEWRAALESKSLKISRSKTEYLYYDFGGVNKDDDAQITIEGQEVPQSTKFKYLGSFVHSDRGIDSDVAHRVQVGWCRWRAATGVLCDRRFPTKLKGKFYKVAVRPAMLYGTDCWAIKKTHARKFEVEEKERKEELNAVKILIRELASSTNDTKTLLETIVNKEKDGTIKKKPPKKEKVKKPPGFENKQRRVACLD